MATIALVSIYDEFCLGLRSLRAILLQAGHRAPLIAMHSYRRVMVGDAPFHPPSHSVMRQVRPSGIEYLPFPFPISEAETGLFLQLLARLQVDAVGISLCFLAREQAAQLTHAIHQRLQLPVIWGGTHALSQTDDALQHADIVCITEGEPVILEIARRLDARLPLKDIPGTASTSPDGSPLATPPTPLCRDLDSLPFPDWSLEDFFWIADDELHSGQYPPDSQINHNYKLMTARDCPFSCGYCYNEALNRRFPEKRSLRRRSVASVIAELRAAHQRMGTMYVEFEDDIFTMNPSWVREFATAYRREIAMPFWCYTHPAFCRQDVLLELKNAGLQYVVMGLQSGSDHILRDVFNRRVTSAENLAAAQLIAACGIPACYDLIVRNPFETDDDRRANLDLLARLPAPYTLHLPVLIGFPGTRVAQLLDQTGQDPEPIDGQQAQAWETLYFLASTGLLSRDQLIDLSHLLPSEPLSQVLAVLVETCFSHQKQLESGEHRHHLLQDHIATLQRELATLRGKRTVRLALHVSHLWHRVRTLLAR